MCGTYPGGYDYPGAAVIMDTQGKGLFRIEGAPHSRFCGDSKIVWRLTSGPWGSGEESLVCYDLNSKKRVDLAFDPMHSFDTPVPSADGMKIAYTFNPLENRGELWVVNIDGSNRLRLLGGKDFDDQYLSNVSFSPNGNSILFIPIKKRGYDREPRGAIHVVDVDGSNLRAITDAIVRWRGEVSWSPDGTQIVFTSDKDSNDELYTVNVDGSALRRITDNTTMDCCPDW